MLGFITVHTDRNEPISISIKHIAYFSDNIVILSEPNDKKIVCKEWHSAIASLIEKNMEDTDE